MFYYRMTYVPYGGEPITANVATEAPLHEALKELYEDWNIERVLSIEGHWGDKYEVQSIH